MEIVTVTADTFEQVLPLVAAYQRFYEAVPDPARNRAHFSQFLTDHTVGIQFVALAEDRRALGFATVYRVQYSVTPGAGYLMNDLFTIPEARGKGIGRALISHCLRYAQACGSTALEWRTAPSNERAQRLYDSTGATRTSWLTYMLPVDSLEKE